MCCCGGGIGCGSCGISRNFAAIHFVYPPLCFREQQSVQAPNLNAFVYVLHCLHFHYIGSK